MKLSDLVKGATGPTPIETDQHTFFWGKEDSEMLRHMCAINNDYCDQVRAIVKLGRKEYALDEIDCRNCKTSEGWGVMRFGLEIPQSSGETANGAS